MQDTFNRALEEPGERPRLLVVDDTPSNIQTLYQIFCEDHQVLMHAMRKRHCAFAHCNGPT